MNTRMQKVFLSLGSNLGERKKFLIEAIGELQNHIGKLIVDSELYETEPWGFETSEKFLNMVVVFETELSPFDVLQICLEVESGLGRKRKLTGGYTSRTIDIDVLFYADLVLETSKLVLPHPHIQNRKFILAPLYDVAPDLQHPLLGQTVEQLLKTCPDHGEVVPAGKLNFND